MKSAAPSHELVIRDAGAAARQWLANADPIARARNEAEFGADVAKLLELPFDKAWPLLSERAEAGDRKAARAAIMITAICRTAAGASNGKYPPFPGLEGSWRTFVDALVSAQRENLPERLRQCRGVPGPDDAKSLMFDWFMRPGNPDAELMVANENPDTEAAISDLRAIAQATGDPGAERALEVRSLQSSDPAVAREAREALVHRATDDPEAARELGWCYERGCVGQPSDPSSALEWAEQAAGLGDGDAIDILILTLDEENDPARAWAWSLFKLDLALAGCFEIVRPAYWEIAWAAEHEERRRARLTPAEHNAGLAMAYEISGRWLKEARERLACAE